MNVQFLNLVEFSWICLRPLIKYGMRGSLLNLNEWVFVMLLLCLIGSFLENRFQRVVLNDQMSERLPVRAGVPQASILGHSFF